MKLQSQKSDECIDAIKAILAIAPMLPIDANNAQAWTDAITSILINIGGRSSIVEHPGCSGETQGQNLPAAIKTKKYPAVAGQLPSE